MDKTYIIGGAAYVVVAAAYGIRGAVGWVCTYDRHYPQGVRIAAREWAGIGLRSVVWPLTLLGAALGGAVDCVRWAWALRPQLKPKIDIRADDSGFIVATSKNKIDIEEFRRTWNRQWAEIAKKYPFPCDNHNWLDVTTMADGGKKREICSWCGTEKTSRVQSYGRLSIDGQVIGDVVTQEFRLNEEIRCQIILVDGAHPSRYMGFISQFTLIKADASTVIFDGFINVLDVESPLHGVVQANITIQITGRPRVAA